MLGCRISSRHPRDVPVPSDAMRTLTAAMFSLSVVALTASAHPFDDARAEGVRAGAEVDRLAWLSGCWTQPRANGLVEEQWMTPRGGSMLGMSRTVVGGKTVEYEFLRIAVVDGTLTYVAKPSGQAEAAFPVKSLEEGVVNGEARGRDFPYRRCAS